LAAVFTAGCGSSEGSKGFLGIQFPSSSQDKVDEQVLRQQRQLEVFDRTVRNPSADIDPEIRRQAAEELIAMDQPEATARLAEALGSGEPTVETAVIDAMEASPEPVEGLLPTAVATLGDVSGPRLEKLSLVLSRYGQPALQRVAALARDQNQAPDRRVGAIYALATFRSRDSAVELMSILDEQRAEPPEIISATGGSLERLTSSRTSRSRAGCGSWCCT
jgi:HEAT repeat protein